MPECTPPLPQELLRPAERGDSNSLKVGQQCLTIGNPFGAPCNGPMIIPHLLPRTRPCLHLRRNACMHQLQPVLHS